MSRSISRITASGSKYSGGMYRITDRGFFAKDALALAKDLLGKILIHEVNGEILAIRITETEAYLGAEDLASHSALGRMTRRNRVMFGEPGFSYVFMIYGMYYCFNITCNTVGRHEAVLVRAGEPVLGTETLLRNRRLENTKKSQAARLKSIADGPGKLCMAMAINSEQNELDLADPETDNQLYIAQDGAVIPLEDIISDVRIGIDYAGEYRDKPWRFYLRDHAASLTKEKRLQRQKKNV